MTLAKGTDAPGGRRVLSRIGLTIHPAAYEPRHARPKGAPVPAPRAFPDPDGGGRHRAGAVVLDDYDAETQRIFTGMTGGDREHPGHGDDAGWDDGADDDPDGDGADRAAARWPMPPAPVTLPAGAPGSRALADDLAFTWAGPGVPAALAVHPYVKGAAAAWAVFAERTRLAAAIQAGEQDWRDHFEFPEGTINPRGLAVQRMSAGADRAWAELGGPR